MTFPLAPVPPLGEDLPLHQIEDHAERALARLLTQFKEKPRLEALIRILVKPYQEIEDVIWQLRARLRLEDCEGEQLNVWGRVLDEPRGAFGDVDYRTILAIKKLVLRSSGTADELMQIAETLVGSTNYVYRELFPAAESFDLLTAPIFNVALVAKFLRRAKSAGVRLDIWQSAGAVRYASVTSGGGSGSYSSVSSPGGSGVYGGVL